mmetsp:Transcript_29182/g.59685  ORF Transcript_29182/g.59685 Transcript_29182/m.59685 type:complete len:83 (-) Transcript_29182:421-669(-)
MTTSGAAFKRNGTECILWISNTTHAHNFFFWRRRKNFIKCIYCKDIKHLMAKMTILADLDTCAHSKTFIGATIKAFIALLTG